MSQAPSHPDPGPWSDECESRVARYEQLWESANPSLADLAEQLEDCADAIQRHELLTELIKVDLEYRWRKANGRLRADSPDTATTENYLVAFPELRGNQPLILDLTAEEYRARRRWGDLPSPESFVARFPALAENLIRRLEEIDKDLASDAEPAFAPEPETALGDSAHRRTLAAAPTPRGATVSKHVDFLWRIKPFSELPETIVAAVAAEMSEHTYAPGDTLVRQGAQSASLIVLTEGDVEISIVDGEGRRRTIDRASRGAVLGEMALVSNQPHSADVTAISEVRALVLPVEKLHRIARQFPPLGAGFADLAARRLGRREVDVLYDKSIEGYRLKRRLGQGAMAVVYEAEEEATGRRVALKMMRPQLAYDLVAVKRFHQEANTMASLQHPNILQVHGCFAAYNTSFIAMDLCEGPTLARLIDRAAPLYEPQIWPILGQLAAALQFAHGKGVLHRDLKPGNVLIQWDGTLKLSDFGLARSFLSNGLTSRGEVLGTPRYMPPEQLIGTNVDQRADIYALGCIAFELVKGEPLFQEPDVTRLLALQLNWSLDVALARPPAKPAPADHTISPRMRQFLAQTLANDRTQRSANLAELAAQAAPVPNDLLAIGSSRR